METKTIWDKHGNRIGEDVITRDRDGLFCTTHYDTAHNCIGRSYQTRDYRGEIYLIHEDASGRILARGALEQDWWGNFYIRTEEARYGRDKKEQEKRQNQTEDATDEHEEFPVAELIFSILIGAGKLLIGFLLFALLMNGIPMIFLLLIPSANSLGWGEGFFWMAALFQMAYIPYLIIMIWRRIRKHMTWGGVLEKWLLWLVIGPFVYAKLLQKGPDPRMSGVMPYTGYCASCRRLECITIQAERCSVCGAKLVVPPPKNAQTVNRLCPRCLRSCHCNDRFCSCCGQDLSEKNRSAVPAPPQR